MATAMDASVQLPPEVTGMPNLKLDESYYALDSEELAFFKSATGIDNEDALKRHIIDVQTRAYKVYPYTCIRYLTFTKLQISRLPIYQHVLKLGKERKNPILLDIGCCFGNDARKVVFDGYPAESVIGSDLRPEYWKLGSELLKAVQEQFPISFIPGDAFDDAFLSEEAVYYDIPQITAPPLNSVTSLNELHGLVSAIHASLFFHLFDENQQFKLAQRLASLLSPIPGSVIFGSHGSMPEKGFREHLVEGQTLKMFCHDPQSWEALWDGVIFKKGTVKVQTELKKVETARFLVDIPDGQLWMLDWAVIRL